MSFGLLVRFSGFKVIGCLKLASSGFLRLLASNIVFLAWGISFRGAGFDMNTVQGLPSPQATYMQGFGVRVGFRVYRV